MKYDYLIVGAGLFGAVFTHEATAAGKTCLVIDKRAHPGGNIYTKSVNGITVHAYGAHIFHTGDQRVWEYISQFAEFNSYVHSPVANYHGEIYPLPFNMNTFSKLWNISLPSEAERIICKQKLTCETPRNLEEQAISLVGRDVYEKLIKGYTEKQWGRSAKDLPSFIIQRIPVRFTYDNRYFNDRWQGIPVGGYTPIIEKLLSGAKVALNTDFFSHRAELENCAERVIYTGMIDQYFNYCFGPLEYRSLRFEEETLPVENFQGCAVMNYTARETPYTRIIEHKHFEFGTQTNTVITKEYPQTWGPSSEPYYPVNDQQNNELYEKYRALAARQDKTVFGGRLGNYKYLDMDKTIALALECAAQNIK